MKTGLGVPGGTRYRTLYPGPGTSGSGVSPHDSVKVTLSVPGYAVPRNPRGTENAITCTQKTCKNKNKSKNCCNGLTRSTASSSTRPGRYASPLNLLKTVAALPVTGTLYTQLKKEFPGTDLHRLLVLGTEHLLTATQSVLHLSQRGARLRGNETHSHHLPAPAGDPIGCSETACGLFGELPTELL
eukprot:3937532-Rhodomonas_salina.2